MSGNWSETWSIQCILTVLASLILKSARCNITTISLKWVSTDREQLVVLHLGESMRCAIKEFCKPGVRSLSRQISKRYSCDSLLDILNLFHFQSCNSVFVSLVAYTTGQSFVYRQSRPHCTMNNCGAMQAIFDAPLMLILKNPQGAYHFLFDL